MALNDNDLLFINDSTDSNKGKSVKLKTLKDNILTGGSSDTFVEIAGDNMTGNLTLGTDKITLNATNGSGTFVGSVAVAGGVATTGNGIDVASDGVVRIRRDIDAEALSIYKNGNSVNERVVVLSTDGNAAFDGAITAGSGTFAGDITLNGTGNGEIFLSANIGGAGGYYRQKLDEGANGGVWRIMNSAGDDVANIQHDGSGLFAGPVTVSRTDSSTVCFSAKHNSSENASITADGGASFAGANCIIQSNGIIKSRGYSMDLLAQL